MTTVCIIGVGLIGGSLGKSLRGRAGGRRRFHVVGMGRSRARLKLAKRLGAIDEGTTRLSAAVSDADLVVVCVPVQRIVPLIAQMVPWLKPGAVVTDVGSTKTRIVSDIKKLLLRRKNVSFVGGHPLAGSEKTGVRNAEGGLFRGTRCVLTSDGATLPARRRVASMWRFAGAKTVEMTAKKHDEALAVTSHLPHAVAFALFASAIQASRTRPEIRKLCSRSFRDMTRIVGSDADLWTGIFSHNRRNLRTIARRFSSFFHQITAGRERDVLRLLGRLSSAKKSWER